jgi:signal transduction histidine kinase
LANVTLQDLIASIIRVQEAEMTLKDIHLIVEMPDIPLHAVIDYERITQAITNLLMNAISYTPSGGFITVRLAAKTESENGTTYAVLSITDSGIGIARENLDHVFEPFFRIKNDDEVKGTGLGLSIAKQIINLHGGQIRVESEPGQGSCFEIRLPVI